MVNFEDPRLFMVVRTNMASMTMGRIAAQVSHATSHFHHHAIRNEHYDAWANSADGITGTVIVLDGKDLWSTIHSLDGQKLKFVQYGIYADPEYHIGDGDIVHKIPNVETVAWVFGPKNDVRRALGELEAL